MRIGMVLDNTFPPDSRVENEAVSLIGSGHEVYLFCLQRDEEPEMEEINGIRVLRYETNKLEYKLSALAYSIPFYHNVMTAKLRRFIRAAEPEVLHVHDLAVARAAFRVAGECKIPIVLDLHENRPVIMKEYVHLKKWPGKWLISPSTWDKYQGKYVAEADRVIVVTEEAAADLCNSYGVDSNKITVVPNTVSLKLYLQYPIDPEIVNRFSGGFNLLYMGDTGLRRGTDTLIKAMELIGQHIPEARLILVGSNTEDVKLKALVNERNLNDRVIFEGWQDVSLFPSYVAAADVCLSPLKRNRHHDTTFANKIFQYMAGGKPIVVSDCPPQARVAAECKCGMVHEAENEQQLAECIMKIYNDPEIANKMGERAEEAVSNSWNWEITSQKLLKMYSDFSSNL